MMYSKAEDTEYICNIFRYVNWNKFHWAIVKVLAGLIPLEALEENSFSYAAYEPYSLHFLSSQKEFLS